MGFQSSASLHIFTALIPMVTIFGLIDHIDIAFFNNSEVIKCCSGDLFDPRKKLCTIYTS